MFFHYILDLFNNRIFFDRYLFQYISHARSNFFDIMSLQSVYNTINIRLLSSTVLILRTSLYGQTRLVCLVSALLTSMMVIQVRGSISQLP